MKVNKVNKMPPSNSSTSSPTKRQKKMTSILTIGSYNVMIGVNLLSEIPVHVLQIVSSERYVLLVDENVAQLYCDSLKSAFQSHGVSLLIKIVSSGEQTKSRQVKANVEDWMISHGCNRKTCLLALGGGVVGDLCGFIASTFMRGIAYIQIPTSLLAMVDSSIGGKTAIDIPAGKNLIGSFYNPKCIIMNVSFLKTLPQNHLINGMAEVIKSAAIASEELFTFLERNSEKIMNYNLEILEHVVRQCIKIKGDVVTNDYKESGMRSILNFGHSVGHAIEMLGQHFTSPLLHGEAVSIGMIYEALIARTLQHLSSASIARLEQCLKMYKLPTQIGGKRIDEQFNAEDILKIMAVDKKNVKGKKNVVMLTSIGQCLTKPFTTPVDDDLLKLTLSPFACVLPSIAHGSLSVPGSKSISNRVLLLAALGKGICRIKGLLHSHDTQVMLKSLNLLGVKFYWEDNQQILVIEGSSGQFKEPEEELYLKNAGTASRFLTTLVTTLPKGTITLTGNARMKQRPIGDLVTALRSNGCAIDYIEKDGSLPIRITGVGGLNGGRITLAASVSSQYVSSILMSAPYSNKPITLHLDESQGSIVSRAYIDMTVALMKQFGIEVQQTKLTEFQIPHGVYENPANFTVEGDASSATYPLALAAITGGCVTVTNVGSNSIQGDAGFCHLLKKMGCKVTQTSTSTTVQGPLIQERECLLSISEDIDMDKLTDTFMTLAVVAACSKGTTRIINIANQRVKECNRIEAMVSELGKCGIVAKELPTGIEIHGQERLQATNSHVRPYTLIDCYDDHRIAMSFAVLGARVGRLVMNSKTCVGKTYPSFWDDITNYLHIKLDANHLQHFSEGNIKKTYPSQNSIIIIGMRGAGKTTLGKYVAQNLGYQFVDLDHQLEEEIGITIKEFVEKSGWDLFRKKELEVFKKVVCADDNIVRVISCGGGIIETPEAFQILKSFPVVVQIHRHIDDIFAYLNQDSERPAYNIGEVWERRKHLYREAAKFEFPSIKGCEYIDVHKEEFLRFIKTIIGAKTFKIQQGTFSLALTSGDVNDFGPILNEISKGVDALELRVDYLNNHSFEFIQEQIAILRRKTHLPVIFTVRSSGQGGKFPDNENAIFDLLKLAIRLGCEFVDMEGHWSIESRSQLLNNKKHSQIIASHRVHNGTPLNQELVSLFHRLNHNSKADIVKLVTTANEQQDAMRLMNVAKTINLPGKTPIIPLAMGEKGKITQVLNQFFTPVTHHLLTPAKHGMMSVLDIQSIRQGIGMLKPKSFCIFGSPVTHSPSPLMHNTGFEWCHLPYKYSKVDTIDPNVARDMIKNENFGGCSVTMPLKEKLFDFVDEVSEAVKKIGALNTITKTNDGRLLGENTDWKGIVDPLRHYIFDVKECDCAIVIGGGGTARAACYALKQIGFTGEKLVVHNPRTPSKATALAKNFDCKAVTPLDRDALSKLFGNFSIRVIICTLPPTAEWIVPLELIDKISPPIIFDVAYMPVEGTLLTKQAIEKKWVLIRGIDMLIAQGLRQFDLWSPGRASSVNPIINKTVRTAYENKAI